MLDPGLSGLAFSPTYDLAVRRPGGAQTLWHRIDCTIRLLLWTAFIAIWLCCDVQGASQGTLGGPPLEGLIPGSLKTDTKALLDFYSSLTNKTSLMADPHPWGIGGPCNGTNSTAWRGITCEGGRVVGIFVSGMGLAGRYPASLGNLYALRNLTLDIFGMRPFNRWTGPLPDSWGSLSRLEVLNVAGPPFNVSLVFEGAPMQGFDLPPSWSNMTSLRQVKLKFLNLTGPMPVAWKKFKDLQKLDLSSNWLTGALPVSWGRPGVFEELKLLDLSCNLLSGSVPPMWFGTGAFPSMTAMLLTSNKLSGSLPVPENSSAVSVLTTEGERRGFALAAAPQLAGFGFCGPVPQGLAVYGDPTAGRTGNDWLMNTTLPPITEFDMACPGMANHQQETFNVLQFIGVMIGSSVGFTIIAGVIHYAWRRKRKRAVEKSFKAGVKAGIHSPLTADNSDDSGSSAGPPFKKHGHGSTSIYTTGFGKSSTNSSLTGPRSVVVWGMSDISDSWDIIQAAEINVQEQDGHEWLLGEGSYGKVFKGLRDGVQDVAIKVFKGEAKHAENFNKEIQLLRSCRSSHIVQFQGMAKVEEDVWLLMEFMEKGNLSDALAKDPNARWYQKGGQIAMDIAQGMAFLHSRGVIHLDLKSPNVLLKRDYTAKIADVGLSHIIGSHSHASQLMAGSFHWMAPEVMVYRRATYKADVFSFGVILWEICTGESPRRGRLRPLQAPDDCPQEVADLVNQCLQQDFNLRPTAKEAIFILRDILHMKGGGAEVEDAAATEIQPLGLSSLLMPPVHEIGELDPETLGLPDPASSPQEPGTPTRTYTRAPGPWGADSEITTGTDSEASRGTVQKVPGHPSPPFAPPSPFSGLPSPASSNTSAQASSAGEASGGARSPPFAPPSPFVAVPFSAQASASPQASSLGVGVGNSSPQPFAPPSPSPAAPLLAPSDPSSLASSVGEASAGSSPPYAPPSPFSTPPLGAPSRGSPQSSTTGKGSGESRSNGQSQASPGTSWQPPPSPFASPLKLPARP
eukprot:jgi/Botrbrau1/13193/Bobra.0351s0006.1